MARQDTVLVHPNREKRSSKATKSAVILLLVVSAALVAVVLIGGWTRMAGAKPFAVLWVVVYAILAYYVAQWSRGPLALAAGLAIFFAVIAVVVTPAWFARSEGGFDEPLLPAALLGLLTLILVPLQLLLVVVAMRAFNQQWNVEVEVTKEEAERGDYRDSDEDEDEDGSAGRGPHSQEDSEDAEASSADRGPTGPDADEGQSPGGGDTRGRSGDEGGGTGEDTQPSETGGDRNP